MSQDRDDTGRRLKRERNGPWQPIFDNGTDSQPQGLLDFPPGTNVSVACDLSLWQLIVIQVSNAFYSFISLGIYRFWGRTRLRKVVWDSVDFSGSRLIYMGTGLELFVSTLLVLMAFLPPLTLLVLCVAVVPIGGFLFWACAVGAILLLFFLYYAGLYLRMRYWAIKTTWRSIRGNLSGGAIIFALIAFWQCTLVIATLGLWWPRMQMRLSGYMVRHLSLGNFQPSWIENRLGLLSAWVLVWGMALFTLGCWVAWISIGTFDSQTSLGIPVGRAVFLTLAIAGSVCTAFLHMAYDVALVRARIASVAIDDLYAFSMVDYVQMLWLNTRILAVYAALFVALGLLALLSYPAWSPWLMQTAQATVFFLDDRGLAQAWTPSVNTLQTITVLAVLVLLTQRVGQLIAPLMRVLFWLHIHKRTLVFEGRLNFTKISQVEPGRFRSLGEGVALALDAGGL